MSTGVLFVESHKENVLRLDIRVGQPSVSQIPSHLAGNYVGHKSRQNVLSVAVNGSLGLFKFTTPSGVIFQVFSGLRAKTRGVEMH